MSESDAAHLLEQLESAVAQLEAKFSVKTSVPTNSKSSQNPKEQKATKKAKSKKRSESAEKRKPIASASDQMESVETNRQPSLVSQTKRTQSPIAAPTNDNKTTQVNPVRPASVEVKSMKKPKSRQSALKLPPPTTDNASEADKQPMRELVSSISIPIPNTTPTYVAITTAAPATKPKESSGVTSTASHLPRSLKPARHSSGYVFRPVTATFHPKLISKYRPAKFSQQTTPNFVPLNISIQPQTTATQSSARSSALPTATRFSFNPEAAFSSLDAQLDKFQLFLDILEQKFLTERKINDSQQSQIQSLHRQILTLQREKRAQTVENEQSEMFQNQLISQEQELTQFLEHALKELQIEWLKSSSPEAVKLEEKNNQSRGVSDPVSAEMVDAVRSRLEEKWS